MKAIVPNVSPVRDLLTDRMIRPADGPVHFRDPNAAWIGELTATPLRDRTGWRLTRHTEP